MGGETQPYYYYYYYYYYYQTHVALTAQRLRPRRPSPWHTTSVGLSLSTVLATHASTTLFRIRSFPRVACVLTIAVAMLHSSRVRGPSSASTSRCCSQEV